MHQSEAVQIKISARDRARRLMNQLTAGVAVVAVAGVGALGYVSATTIPGAPSSTTTSSAAASTSSSSASGLSSSSGTVSTSSGSGVAVSGGS